MKKNFFWMLIPLLAFVSCNNELEDSLNANQNQGAAGIDYPFYPSAIMYSDGDMPHTRAGVYNDRKWDDFAVIKIYFMSGEPAIVSKVKAIASQYTDLTNLTFKYVDNAAESDVRIRFTYTGISNYELVNWSYLGTECQSQTKTSPTMNLVIQDAGAYLNSDMFRGEVLRNFGRMLGMVYEYSYINDNTYVELNKSAVMADFQSKGWAWATNAKERVNINKLFFAPSVWSEDFTVNDVAAVFDSTSIMLPRIPLSWIDEFMSFGEYFGLVVEKNNTQLSDNDKEYISSVYPKPKPLYIQGKKSNITISLASLPINFGWGLGYNGWDYRIGTEIADRRIIGNYPTIGIGEYEWTTVNLRMKYRGESLDFINFDNTMVNFFVGNTFGNDANTVNKFEQIFGTWVTEISTNEYNQTITYRDDDAVFTRNDAVFLPENVAFDLPDVTAIQQLFGQMPHETGNVYTDFRNFTFGLPDDIINDEPQLAAGISQEMPLLNGEYNDNISGLSLLPLGSMDSHPLGMNVYEPHHTWTNGSNAFMTKGTGIKLKMKGVQRNFNFHESGSANKEIILNQHLFHWGSARYCRALTDGELGYKLYIDESSNIVVRFGLDELPDENEDEYTELPRGIERGVALSSLYIDEDNGIYYFTKSWSQIQQIAATVRAYVRVH